MSKQTKHRIGLKAKYLMSHDRDWHKNDKCKRCDLFMGQVSGKRDVVCNPQKRVVIVGVEL